MADLMNKKKIKRLLAQGNRLEAMNLFLQSKFGESSVQTFSEQISDYSCEERKLQTCEKNKEINENTQENKGSSENTDSKEEIVEVEDVDVETVDPLARKEMTLTGTTTCQTLPSIPFSSCLDTSQQNCAQSDKRTFQSEQHSTVECLPVNQLKKNIQMSASFTNARPQSMSSQQLMRRHESSQQYSLVDHQDVSFLSQCGNNREAPYASCNPQVVDNSPCSSYGDHAIQNNWEPSPQEQKDKPQSESHCRIPASIPMETQFDRKKQSTLDTLKKNNQKDFRDQGLPYISRTTGKEIKGRAMGAPCKCKKKCWSRVKSGAEEIFIAFWDMGNFYEQNVYLYGNISINPVRRHYVKDSNRRTYTFKYWVKVHGKHVEVCKEMFMGVHGLQKSRGRISNLMKQMKEGSLLPKADQRGKHSNRPNKYTEQVLNGAQRHIESFIHQNITLRVLYRDYYLPWCEEQKISAVSEDKYRRLYSGNNKIS